MTTILAEFGKFRYNCFPIGICALGHILQAKLDKLLGDIEGVKTYRNDILFLRKEVFSNHKEQPRIIFVILRAAGLKYNDPK